MLIMPICLMFLIVLSLIAFFTSNFLAVIVSTLVLLALSFWLLRRERFAVLFLLLLFSITLTFSLNRIASLERLGNQTIKAEFTVLEEPVKTSRAQAVTVRANGINMPRNTKLNLTFADTSLKMGGQYRADITLHTEKFRKGYYYSDNIYSHATLSSAPYFIKEKPILIALGNIRAYIKSCLYANLTPNEAATLNAITVGEKSGFSNEFSYLVRRSGTSHIMVVSGMHFAIIMSAVFKIIGRFWGSKITRAILALIGVIFISALCGFTMSILRAGLTYVIIALAPIFKRDYDPINTLCFAVILIMLFSPFAVFSISLQLSFLATLGILSLSPLIMNKIEGLLKSKVKLLDFIISPLVMSISATFTTLPVVIYYFNEVSVVAPVTNVLVSFAVTLALLAAAGGILISVIPIISVLQVPVFSLANIVTKYINTVISYFGSLSFATVEIHPMWSIVAALLVILLLLLINYSKLNLYYKHIKIFRKEKHDARNL